MTQRIAVVGMAAIANGKKNLNTPPRSTIVPTANIPNPQNVLSAPPCLAGAFERRRTSSDCRRDWYILTPWLDHSSLTF
jgi:hypothetical protein